MSSPVRIVLGRSLSARSLIKEVILGEQESSSFQRLIHPCSWHIAGRPIRAEAGQEVTVEARFPAFPNATDHQATLLSPNEVQV